MVAVRFVFSYLTTFLQGRHESAVMHAPFSGRSSFAAGVARLLLSIFLTLTLIGQAHAETTPRGAEHDSFGRMVFDWDRQVQWSANTDGNQLAVKFDRAIAGDPKVLLKPLSRYLKGVTLSADKKVATFTLTGPVKLKTFLSGTSTVVDMTPSKEETTKAPTTPPPGALPPVTLPVVTPPATAEKPATEKAPGKPASNLPVTNLNVRGGGHDGFNRLVFDWPKPVGVKINTLPGQIVIAFDRPANVNTTSLEAALPPDMKIAEIRPEGNGTAVVLSVPAGTSVTHFSLGPKVAVDLGHPRQAATAAEPAPATPIASKPAEAQPQPVAAAEPAPPAPPQQTAPEGAVSLGVGFDQPTGAAAFRRAGWLWLVFDRRSDIDINLLKRTGGDVVLHVEQVPGVKNGTAVRLITKPGYLPSVRKEGQLWVFDLSEQPMAPHAPLAVNRLFDFEDRGRLILPAADVPVKPVIARDPEVGDTIQIMPLVTVGAGLARETLVPGAQLLATAQGVALVPLADGAHLEGTRQGVEVSMPGGLHLSKSLPPVEGGELSHDSSADSSTGGPADVSRWNRGGLDKYQEEHEKLQERLVTIRPEDKNAQRMEMARHSLANGMPAEALGILRLIGAADPAQVDTAPFRALRGIANFLMLRDSEALDDLSHQSLAKDPQAQIWLAAAKARATGDLARNGLLLRLAPEEVKPLTPRLRMALGDIAARATAAAGDFKAVNRIIEAMNGAGLQKRDLDEIAYLQGLAAETAQQWDQAIAKYREAEEGENRPARAYASRARIELQLHRKQITAKDAIEQLQKLRFAWRAGDFEYTLLKRLGELMLDDGQYAEGLRLLRSVTTNYGDNPDIGNVQSMMSDAFEKLFLRGEAEKMQPVAAIGLFDEFQELTPAGDKGDEMIRKLADRLASVDLLERAADLLSHQVKFRLQGIEKARVGARLAYLELADRKPNLALEGLDASEVPDQPADLFNQRRYLRVRALMELGRTGEALALIINDQSDEAKQLRAQIYWDLKKWPEAAAALESSIERPEGNSALRPGTPRRLIDLATALTLARDERGLSRLRRTYGPAMAKTEFKEAFDLLTSEPERGVIDYRTLPDKIKQVENFQSSMSDWNNRVKSQGLSSLN